jgi:hypothetical protein
MQEALLFISQKSKAGSPKDNNQLFYLIKKASNKKIFQVNIQIFSPTKGREMLYPF